MAQEEESMFASPAPKSRVRKRPCWLAAPVQADDIRRLREENERLRNDLKEQQAFLALAAFNLERTSKELSRNKEALLGIYHDFSGWFDAAAFPMTCVGSDGLIEQANNRQLNLLGYLRTEYIGHPLEKFMPDQAVVRAILDAINGEGGLFENRPAGLLCKDGSIKEVLVSTEPFNQGLTHGICCYFNDLSEVSESRSELRRSERLFRQLAENVREVFWMTTPGKEEMLYVSPAYETIWGRTCRSLYESPGSFLEGIVAEDRERVREALPRQVIDNGYCEEYRVERPDGQVRWVRDRAFPVRDDDGKIFRIAGLAEDISISKESEIQQRTLAELGGIALEERSLPKVFEEATERLTAALAADCAQFLRYNPQEKDFLLVAGTGFEPRLIGGAIVSGGEDSHAGFTLRTREPVIVTDLRREDRFAGDALLFDQGVVSGMTTVVEGRGRPFGVLGVYFRRPRELSPDEICFLEAAANILAAAIERRLAEEGQQELTIELGRERRKLDDILANMPAIVWELRLDPKTGELRQSYTSDFAEAMIGFTKEECLENPFLWLDRIHPDDRDRAEREMRAALESEGGSTRFRWIARDGSIVCAETTAKAFTDDAGRVAGLRGVALDITQRKLEKDRRREAEKRIAGILRHLPAVVWESQVDPLTMRITPVFVSDYAEALLGFPKEEWLSNPDFWIERVHPEDQAGVMSRVEKLLATEEVVDEQFRWIARDGRTVWVQTTKQVMRDDRGNVVGVRGVNIDITARKEAEHEREAAEKRFRAFMDNVPLVAFMKDAEGRYIYGNPLFEEQCRDLGVDCYGLTDFEIFREDVANRYRERDREVLEKGVNTQSLDIVYTNGSPEYWETLRFPVDIAGRRTIGAVSIDVTERRRLEAEILEISDREQRRLGQELHDGLCQHLLGVAMMSRTLASRLAKSGLPEAREVQIISDFVYEGLAVARGLMEGFNLANADRPGGLPAALEMFAVTTSRLFGKECVFHSNVAVKTQETGVAAHLFRIAQEATHNAIKHGGPTTVELSLNREGDCFVLKIENDGDPLPQIPPPSSGIGIRTMKYRADLIGAKLEFQNRPGGRVAVICRLPVAGRGIEIAGGEKE